MDRALALSLLLHFSILAPMYFLGIDHDHSRNSGVTLVEFVNYAPEVKNFKRKRQSQSKKFKKIVKDKGDFKSKSEVTQKVTEQVISNDVIDQNTSGPQVAAAVTYARQLQQYIEQNQHYPRRALAMRQTGTVKFRVTIEADGHFSHVEIVEQSEHGILNKAASKLISDLGSFKPLPARFKDQGIFTIPIRYQISRTGSWLFVLNFFNIKAVVSNWIIGFNTNNDFITLGSGW